MPNWGHKVAPSLQQLGPELADKELTVNVAGDPPSTKRSRTSSLTLQSEKT